jgi:DNA-binding NarL/FixJ family response regulator
MNSIYILDSKREARAAVCDWVHRILRESAVQEFQSYDQALQMIATAEPFMLVMEIGIRNGNGMEFIRKMRLQHAHLHILVYTDQDETLYAERALRIGAHGYLMKDASFEDFQFAFETVLRGDLYVSKVIEDKIMRAIARQSERDEFNPERLLSNRELEIFVKIGSGLSSRDIADQLALSIKTVETHRAHIKRKLNIRSARELARQAEEWAERV